MMVRTEIANAQPLFHTGVTGQPVPAGDLIHAAAVNSQLATQLPMASRYTKAMIRFAHQPATTQRHIPEKAYEFGTAGFRPGRAITADEVNAITHAVADVVWTKTKDNQRPLIVLGRDTRESSRGMIDLVQTILTERGIDVLMAEGPLSTPLASYLARHGQQFDEQKRQPTFAYVLTASHNPYQEGGIKLLGPDGVNASKEVTEAIQQFQTKPADAAAVTEPGTVIAVNPTETYLQALKTFVSPEDVAGINTGLDVHYGAGAPFADVLKSYGLNPQLLRLGNPPNGYNSNSEPTKDNLDGLSKLVTRDKMDVGVALDGDADRFAAVDERGKLVSVTDHLAVAIHYLLATKGLKGVIARSQATSGFVDALYTQLTNAEKAPFETPVGFKWFGPLFEKQDKGEGDKILLAMESSGGATSGYHAVYEKDGLLMDTLLLAATAEAKRQGKTLSQWIQHLRDSVPQKFDFAEYAVKDVEKAAVIDALTKLAKDGGTLGGLAVDPKTTAAKADALMKNNGSKDADGLKIYLEGGSWVLIRPSGTENTLRVYIDGQDGGSQEKAKATREAIWQDLADRLVTQFNVDPKNMKNKSES